MVMQAENTAITEGQVAENQVEEQAVESTEESTEEEQPPVITAAQYAELQRRVAEADAFRQQVDPVFQQMERARVAAENARVEELARGIEEASDASDAPLSPQDRAELREVIQLGYEYKRQARDIQEERVAASALNIAAQHLGAGATIAQWQQLAAKLLDLGDPRLMEMYVKERAELTRTNTQAVQRQAGEVRRESGVDRPISAPAGSGGLMSVDAIIQKVNSSGIRSLSDGEKQFWMAERRKAGLPVIN